MLELIETRASVVACFAEPAALDSMVVPSRSVRCLVAPDEVLFVAHPEEGRAVVRQAADRLGVLDPNAIAIDVSDGWSSLTLEGDGIRGAFARLSELELPDEGFVQGKVGGVPAKLFIAGDRLHLMVASMWGEHLLDRVSAEVREAHISTADFDIAGWPT